MFIKLSNVYYDIDKISEFYVDGNGETRICVSTRTTYRYSTVKETIEQILTLIVAEKVKELRDEFAAKVVVGIMRTCDEIHRTIVSRDYIAMEAYRMADAMLKAREGK